MTVATLPGRHSFDLCHDCEGVLPARNSRQYTEQRALIILAKGYCMCPAPSPDQDTTVLDNLAPETQSLYLELRLLSEERERELDDQQPDAPPADTMADIPAYGSSTTTAPTPIPVIDGGGLIIFAHHEPMPSKPVRVKIVRSRELWPLRRRE